MKLIPCASNIGLSQSLDIPRLDPRLVALLGSFSGGGVDSIVRRIPVLAFLAVMFYHCSGVVAPFLGMVASISGRAASISRHGAL